MILRAVARLQQLQSRPQQIGRILISTDILLAVRSAIGALLTSSIISCGLYLTKMETTIIVPAKFAPQTTSNVPRIYSPSNLERPRNLQRKNRDKHPNRVHSLPRPKPSKAFQFLQLNRLFRLPLPNNPWSLFQNSIHLSHKENPRNLPCLHLKLHFRQLPERQLET